MRNILTSGVRIVIAAAVLFPSVLAADAGELLDRAAKGEAIRLGFANNIPWSYTGNSNEPIGFMNTYAVGVLKEMGYTKVEAVVSDYGGLVPGLQANRVDLITGGIYILKSRCGSMAFSEPMAKVSNALIVKAGNPDNIHTYSDLAKTGTTMVTGAGYNDIEAAKKEGVPDEQIMQVPGPTEILAAVSSGTASAGSLNYLEAQDLAKKSGGKIEVTDPELLPEWTQNYAAIAFRNSDADFVEKFNEAARKYMGSPAMMEALKPYGYDEKLLPGDKTKAWACANR